MHFAFDEQQIAFRAQLRAFADKQCTPAHVRQAWDTPTGWSAERWAALADMGVVGLTVPTGHGGLGLGLVDLVLLLEEAGRAGLPEPILETVALAVPLLADAPGAPGAAQRDRWLPAVASGTAVAAVGTADTDVVPVAPGADLLVLQRADEVHAVPAASVSLALRPALDGARRSAAVTWEPAPETLVVSGAAAHVALARLRDRAAVGSAALLVGVADHMIAMAAHYATERTQFGTPIGSFQAVKHQLADALVRVEFARPVDRRAAWSIDVDDPDAAMHASMAKALAADAAVLAARTALQVHGAIGYTWEHDLHLWMKRAWSLVPAWGDAAHHRAKVLEHMVARA